MSGKITHSFFIHKTFCRKFCKKKQDLDLQKNKSGSIKKETGKELAAKCQIKSPHRHFYLFLLGKLSATIANTYSFHRGGLFFPPWWKEKYPAVERNFLRDGKNKSLLMKKLKLIRKNYRNAEIIRYRTVTSYK